MVAELVTSYPDILQHFTNEEPINAQLRRDAIATLPTPPGLFQRMVCMGPPELLPLLKDEQVSSAFL